MLCVSIPYSHTVSHNPTNRVVWVFGGGVTGPITDITPTRLTPGVLATLREADDLAHSVVDQHGMQ